MHKEKDQEIINILDEELLCADDVLMVPEEGILTSRSDAKIKPYIYSAPMDTVTGYNMTRAMIDSGEFPVVCRYLKEEWNRALVEYHSNPKVFFAIGSKREDIEDLVRKLSVVKVGESYGDAEEIPPLSVAVDIAHGDTHHAHALYSWLSAQPFIGNIMSGSVCTADAAMRAYRNGCTHIRVGVGPGAACTTRLMTGCGMPQLSAVYFCAKAVKAIEQQGKPYEIIADGGIRNPGDANKYLAAGATGVMMGKAFAECPESAGWIESDLLPLDQMEGIVEFPLKRPPTVTHKFYRGQASASFQQERFGQTSKCPEGASSTALHPSKTCSEILGKYRSGLASAISYLGLSSIDELKPESVTLVKITPSTYKEGTPHGCD